MNYQPLLTPTQHGVIQFIEFNIATTYSPLAPKTKETPNIITYTNTENCWVASQPLVIITVGREAIHTHTQLKNYDILKYQIRE